MPIAKAGLIDADDIVIDAKSGVSGAGRGLKQNTLFTEAGEGLSPYSVAKHRHAPEIEQEIGVAAGAPVTVNFTPHLIPMSRGELCTSYVRLEGRDAPTIFGQRSIDAYRDEPFVHVAPKGVLPQTQNVRGSNYVQIGVFADRIKGRAIVDLGARQSGEGLGRPGDAEHEHRVRPGGDDGPAPAAAVSVGWAKARNAPCPRCVERVGTLSPRRSRSGFATAQPGRFAHPTASEERGLSAPPAASLRPVVVDRLGSGRGNGRRFGLPPRRRRRLLTPRRLGPIDRLRNSFGLASRLCTDLGHRLALNSLRQRGDLFGVRIAEALG